MGNIGADRIIPIVRGAGHTMVVPIFLGSKLYLDFREDGHYEAGYAELLRDIHEEQISPRPEPGPNPFKTPPTPVIDPQLSFTSERYVSACMAGEVIFEYSNNNGRYVIGAGDMTFETAWSSGGNTSIHAYNEPPSIRTVALAVGVAQIADIFDATIYDTSSRVRTPRLGEIVVWQNSSGYYLATRLERVAARSDGALRDEVVFSYAIASNKSTSFKST